MARLIALHPILYHSHQYKVGEELPTNNLGMMVAWLAAGTAGLEGDVAGGNAKAEAVTAPPGREAITAGGGEALTGKTATGGRKKRTG